MQFCSGNRYVEVVFVEAPDAWEFLGLPILPILRAKLRSVNRSSTARRIAVGASSAIHSVAAFRKLCAKLAGLAVVRHRPRCRYIAQWITGGQHNASSVRRWRTRRRQLSPDALPTTRDSTRSTSRSPRRPPRNGHSSGRHQRLPHQQPGPARGQLNRQKCARPETC